MAAKLKPPLFYCPRCGYVRVSLQTSPGESGRLPIPTPPRCRHGSQRVEMKPVDVST